jgi:hypothetical protein
MCNIYTNEHTFTFSDNTSNFNFPYGGISCQCGAFNIQSVKKNSYEIHGTGIGEYQLIKKWCNVCGMSHEDSTGKCYGKRELNTSGK